MAKALYTIVQHSGAGYGYKPEFEQGLEIREVTDGRFQNKIRTLGGKLFATWSEADDYVDSESYQPGNESLIPNAPGTFVDYEVDELKLYIPKENN